MIRNIVFSIFFFLGIIIISFIFILSGCVSLPGINKNPSKQNLNKNINKSDYSINDIQINLVNINSLSELDINFYNQEKILNNIFII